MIECDVIELGSTFPIERRPIMLWPIASMDRGPDGKQRERALPQIVQAIDQLLDRHTGRVLIHSQTFHIGKEIERMTHHRNRVMLYGGGERDSTLDRYKLTPGAVIVGPSLQRGVDLPDELCEAVVIVVIPYGDLSDKRIAARRRMDGLWYSIEAIRTVVQMSGRGMRHKDDYCVTYILDARFPGFYQRYEHLFPSWWRAAVVKPAVPNLYGSLG
jgi:Rad3-related DNA helicase